MSDALTICWVLLGVFLVVDLVGDAVDRAAKRQEDEDAEDGD